MDWKKIADVTAQVVTALKPFIPVAEAALEAAIPESAAAVHVGTKLVQAAIAGEPAAKALVDRINGNGEPVTPTELQQWAADYEDAYHTLHDDIASQLAATPV